MAQRKAAYRLRKELQALSKDRPEFIWAAHKESNVLLWSFLLAPPSDTVFGGGWYWGRLSFPAEYPFAPPSISLVTPSGRFQSDVRICMSMSDYHPESWNPGWSVSTILKGVLSFMLGDEVTTGACEATDAQRRAFAAKSAAFNAANAEFCLLFPDFDEIRADELLRRSAAAGPAAAPSDGTPSSDVSSDVRCVRGDLEEAAAGDAASAEAYLCAAKAKTTGDAAFRGGLYAEATQAYDAALEAAPRCAAILRNRAAAAEKLGDDAAVVRDCSAALALEAEVGDAPSLKALRRRAAAYERLGQPAAAARDYEAALAVAPAPDLSARLAALATADAAGTAEAAGKKKKQKKKKKKQADGGSDDDDEGDDDADDDAAN
ncbi:ubiquitin-conjugating enzyme/RWD-like protein [Pelagophyceae sp. CCMP2097]|nr:ubiquitin-conjugating enzyme/RWD-like protein [Pelagophyceae sp. CCMP2097]